MIKLPKFHECSYASDNEARIAMLKLSKKDRKDKAESILVRYPRFQEAYGQVLGLHEQGEDGGPIKGEIVGFLGNSRAGKSWLLKTLLNDTQPKLHPSDDDTVKVEASSGLVVPMSYIEVKDKWGAPDMAAALYMATGATSVPYISSKALEFKCVRRVASVQNTFVIMDDAHFIFEAPPSKRKGMFSLIKSLADSGECSVLLAGMNSIEAGMEANRQLFNRASFPAAHIVEHDTTMQEELDHYLEFLAAVSERLPFAQDSGLDRDEWIEEWKLASGGSIGITMNIVKDAARRAIRDEAPCIQGKHLAEAGFMRKRIGQTTYPFQNFKKAT
ncbi:AAA family ATPase [Agrobacterium rosae]|uniref:AAA family ATPase n=1 Tax=Agrobacterium rosae TaxID=1972867 RepID=UPI003A801268